MAVRRARINSLYDLKPGDHIKVDEGLYDHHMMVVNAVSNRTIRVIHNSKEAGRVEERNVRYKREDIIRLVYSSPYSGQEIIRRARRWIGKEYNLLWSNCEHFATEMRTGTPVSYQVGTLGIILAVVCIGAIAYKVYIQNDTDFFSFWKGVVPTAIMLIPLLTCTDYFCKCVEMIT